MSQRYIGGVVTETTDVAKAPWTGEWTQQAALQGFAGAQAPLRIANSLRFRSSASAYLNRTPGSAGNRQTFTWSGWVKKAKIAANQYVFGAETGGNGSYLFFTTSDTLQFYDYVSGSYQFQLITTQVFRDPSAWYHIVLVSDTTNATAANRIRMYVNGVQITAFGTATYPSQNYSNSSIDNTNVQYIGYTASSLDGCLGEVNFIDGQALPPTAFGAINPENGVWAPIAYTGTYGTNGFRLNFSNGTSTTTLGYDSSGNSNNWTTNNISLTAGSTYDWMIDSPTKYPGSSYGVGNYCVGNPLSVGSNTSLSNANLSGTLTGAGGWAGSIGGLTSGKWYWEATLTANSGNSVWVGFLSDAYKLNDNAWSYSTQVALYSNDGRNGNNASYGATWTTNDVIGIALDLDAGSITFYKNNTSQGVMFSSLTASALWRPFVSGGGTGTTIAMNFGQRPFAYTPPSGFKSLCTQNLPNVSIYNGAQYMAATTYTGTGSTVSIANTVNGVSFQPDFVWIKSRSNTSNHALQDSVRGAVNQLSSNLTAAEIVSSGEVTSFNSNGFSVGNDVTGYTTNASGYTYIGWQWKAGGTAVTNTAGSISSQVSANTTAGFSVVTYQNASSGVQTVGHGLGVAPAMIIVRFRNNVSNWYTWHTSIAASNYLLINTTDASTSGSTIWNSTAPTSSVFTLGSAWASGSQYTAVAYCFAAIAGYSAFGSYTGNGSATFVYTGFKPAFLMVKCSSDAEDWYTGDHSRPNYNGTPGSTGPMGYLRADSSVAEGANGWYQFYANGFSMNYPGADTNGSGRTYIYMAFAENPFQNSLAR